MIKTFKHLRFMLVLLLATLGVNVAFGENEIVLNDITPSNYWYEVAGVGRVANKTGNGAFGTPDYAKGNTTCSNVGFKTGSSNFTVQPYIAISGIRVMAASSSNRTLTAVTVAATATVASTSNTVAYTETKTGSYVVNKNSCDNDFTVTFETTVAANKYVNFLLSGNADLIAVELIPAPVGPVDPVLSYNNGTYEIGAAALDLKSLKKSDFKGSDADITYTVTGATISGTSFTAETAGEYTVTATHALTSSYKAGSATFKVNVTAPSVKSAIVYANTKGASTAALPTEYSEGTGIAEFAALEDVTGFHFTGWNPSSISASATGEQTITAEWEVVVAPYFVMNYTKPSDSKVESIVCTNGSVADANATAKALSLETNDIKFSGNDCRLLVTLTDATIVEGTKIEVSWISLYNDGSKTGIGVLNENNANKSMDVTGLGGTSKTETGTESYTFTAAAAANYVDQFIITRNGTGKSLGLTGIKVYNVGPAVPSYSVTFDMQGATSAAIEAQSVKDGQKAVKPADPEKTGFNFVKWVVAATEADYDFDAAVTADVALKAVWEEVHEYAVKYGDDSHLPAGPNVENGTEYVVAACTFEAPTGKVFRHWAVVGVAGVETAVAGDKFTMPANDVVLTAVYAAQHTVRFFDGADQIGDAVLVWDGEKVAKPADPIKIGYHAIGWKNAEVDYDFNAAVTNNLDLTVNWDGPIYAQAVDFEAAATAGTPSPQDVLSANGYWYGGGATTWDNNTSTNNGSYCGLKMKEANSTVEFLAPAGKMLVLKVGILNNSKSDMYQNDIKVAENMQGGSKNAGEANFKTYYFHSDAVAHYMFKTTAGDAQIIKAISFVDPYTVTFTVPAGAEEVAPMTFKAEALTLPTAVKGTDEFLGWFDAAEGGNKIGEAGAPYTPAGDVELFAQFSSCNTNNEIVSFTYGETTVTATEGKREYAIELPYKSEIPATLTYESEAATKGDVAKADNVFTFTVTNECGEAADYTITFTVAPKDGICLIHADITGQGAASVDPAKSTVGGTATANGNVKNASSFGGETGYKFNSEGARMSITLAEGSFKTGDVVKMFITTAQAMPIRAYSDNDATVEVATGAENMVQGLNSAVMTADAATLYLARTGANGWNPNVAYVEVYRAMNPIMSALTVAGVDAVIDQEAKTISVKLPNGTVAADAVLVPTIVANGGEPTAALDGTLAYDTPINYVVTDKDGDQTTYVLTAIEGATPAAEPVITVQPASHNYIDTEVIAALTVEATVSDAGVLSYQWYKGEDAIADATAATFTPTEAGSYKVVVTNTLGEETATATSEVAVITVTHIYTFDAWDGVSTTFTKAGEWTLYPFNKDKRWVITDQKFAADQAISSTDATAKANVFTDQYFLVVFEKDMKEIFVADYYADGNRNVSEVYTVETLGDASTSTSGTSLVQVTGSYTLDKQGRDAAKVSKTTITGHFEAGVNYVFKISSATNAIFEFIATAAELTNTEHAITAVEIGGEALDATELAAFVANYGATLPKTDAAFAVKVTETVKDIYDDGFEKVTATNDYNETAVLDGDNFVATLVINAVTYTVTAPKMADPVAKIGTTAYETLAEAVAAAENGDEILMLADVDLTAQIEIADKAITLDLAGHAINYTGAALGSGVILVHNGAGLTINDSSDPDAGQIVANAAYAAIALTKKLDDASNAAVLVVNGGTLTGKYYAVVGNGSRPNTEITINGGTLTAVEPGDNMGIYHPQCGTLTINGGTIVAETGIAIKAGVLTINGGTIHATGANGTPTEAFGNGVNVSGAAIQIESNNSYGVACAQEVELHITDGEITSDNAPAIYEYVANAATETHMTNSNINGGTINGAQPVYVSAGVEGFIAGGTFNQAVPATACAAGFEPKDNGDGTYGVKVQEAILPISESTTWRWADIADQAEDVVAQFTNINLATRITSTTEFKSQSLKATGTRTVRLESGHYFAQVSNITFETTVPGFVTISMRSTGSGKTVTATIQGTEAGSATNNFKTLDKVFVNAGEVSIDITGDGLGRIELIEFTEATTVRDGMTMGKVATYCGSKNVIAHDGATFYFISDKASDLSSIELTEVVGELKAGYPYIVVAEKSEIHVVYGDVVDTEAKNYNGLYGVLGETVILVDGDYIIKNNKYYRAHTGNGNYVQDGRAYLRLDEIQAETMAPGESAPAPARARRITMGNAETSVTTGMDAIQMTEDLKKIIVDGQLFIIRGGKMFNAAGALVK